MIDPTVAAEGPLPLLRPKLGWALCGLGDMSAAIASSLQRTRHCVLTGLVTSTPEKGRIWGARYNVESHNIYSYENMESAARSQDIDVIYIATPHALHLDHAIRAFTAGKHVFVEKPMEISPARCQQMIDAANAARRRLGVAYRVRFEPNNLECIRIARQEEFGATRFVESEFCIRVGAEDQWRLKRRLSGGGALMDVGVYALQAARYITGDEPVAVAAMDAKTNVHKFREVEEHLVWHMRFPSGTLATCTASYEAAGTSRIFVQAERGWFELDNAFADKNIHGRRSDGKLISKPNIDQLAAQMDHFSQCILNNVNTVFDGEEGLRDSRVIEAVYKSIESRCTIAVNHTKKPDSAAGSR